MKTMYLAEENEYVDMDGYKKEYETKGIYDTYEEALAKVDTFPKRTSRHNNGYITGDWRIVKKTMDEATFTVTTEVVKEYIWLNEN